MAQLYSHSHPHCHTSSPAKLRRTSHIKALASVYAPVVSQSATEMYHTGLKEIAKLSSKDFEDVLRGELSRISETVDREDSEDQEEDTETNPDDVQGRAFETKE